MSRLGASPTRLAVDAMLGSLARKLRSFGFDTIYYNGGQDADLLGLCRRQRRILVTADRLLSIRAERAGLGVLLVSGSTDGSRITAMIAGARQRGLALRKGESLCSVCNGRLTPIPKSAAVETLPAAVVRRHRTFLRCEDCGKVYWRGSHWKKLRRLERLFENRR
ncbi:MAG: hypothetical protein LYZ70_00360 [Nitrososphaerales archaeon]|nr:hypothetical protein [Nitrososphaerales archaeon]